MSNSFAAPWTVAYKAPLSSEFSRWEYWSGLPFPPQNIAANGNILFFFMPELYSIVCIYRMLSQSSVDWQLSCFHVLDIINCAAMNIGVHISFWIRVFIFFRYIFKSGIARWYASSIFSLLRNLHSVFFYWLHQFIFPLTV